MYVYWWKSGWEDDQCCSGTGKGRIEIEPPKDWRLGTGTLEPMEVRYETYRSMSFGGRYREFKVFVLSGLTGDDVIEKLLLAYKSIANLNELEQKLGKEYEMVRIIKTMLLSDPAEGIQ